MSAINRRKFIRQVGLTTLLPLASGSLSGCFSGQNQKKRLGVALVGLGYYSSDLLAPALQLTENCYLAGIVTGSPEKVPVWQEKYGIPDENVYNYDNMHEMETNDAIDVVYVVLPNSLHREYVIKAANMGKHVWCEKPMALNEAECRDMIDACRQNNVKLSIGYRMQHEPNTQTIIGYGRDKTYGDIQRIVTEAGFYYNATDVWRLKKSMGGGAMFDMGVYSLNAARYVTGEEPIAVTARHETNRPDIYTEVDEFTYFDLEFPSGAIANCKTSFGEDLNLLDVTCTNGGYQLSPFQSYNGIKGSTSDGKILDIQIPNQQARQMDENSLAIMEDKPVLVPGEEGLKDVRIVEAIFKSAATGERVVIGS
ncbi:MAG: Gfo/Idh/MocA family oxidoreductase [Cyclobacteriaceae bacterium]|nr:Gfo/Idh/MocA family oxidoreductase [Cyclobacteriaceae bacterium]